MHPGFTFGVCDLLLLADEPSSLPVDRNLKNRHFGPLFIDVAVESPGNESIAVGVDEVARDILSQGNTRGSWEIEFSGTCSPERDYRRSQNRTDLKTIARQKAFHG